MNERSKNKRTTTRPSFKQSRRGRAYYSAQSAGSRGTNKGRRTQEPTRSDESNRTNRATLQQQSSSVVGQAQRSSALQEEILKQDRTFEVANRRHMRWEVWFVVAVVVLLAIILGTGGFIAAKRSQDAMTRASITSVSKESQVASSQSDAAGAGENDPNANEDKGAQENPSTSVTVDGSLTSRDQAFAVDPNNTEWVSVDDDRKVVYLTFDDGPSAHTQAVLDILDRYGCKATFFVVGSGEAYYPMIGEAYRRGHTIGMHTYSHDYAKVYASEDAFFSDLTLISRIVKDQIGYVPVFIRFAGGSSNDISAKYNEGIMSRLVEEVRARGYQYFDWDVSFGDGSEHTTEELIEYACEPTDLQKIVILCHDSGEKQTTIEALPSIIEHYQALGYSFEALDRTTPPVHHAVMN